MEDIREKVEAKHAKVMLLVQGDATSVDFPGVTAFEVMLAGCISTGTEEDRRKLYKVYPEYVAAYVISKEPHGFEALTQIVAQEDES